MSGGDKGTVSHHHPDPPEVWTAARDAAKRLLSPVDRFLSIEASSGIVLLVAAVVALAWANSPWHSTYEAVLRTPIGLEVGSWKFTRGVHFWINDGLMAIFFFVVGLEIKRELHGGELSEVRRAALPVFAALGGMLVPATIYLVFNSGTRASNGWGVPMATDIAFAVGILALLGKRVPPALRILLLALAVIDDLGAILVIAVFYSSGFSVAGLLIALAGIAIILGMQKLGVRLAWAYVPAAVLTWAGVYATGVHPTIAGVVIGLLTPVRAWFGPDKFVDHANAAVESVKADSLDRDGQRLLSTLDHLNVARREAVSPVERLQHTLHGWVAFGIMPLFALANAGVALGDVRLDGGAALVLVGVLVGLVLGKPIGVVAVAWLAVRARVAVLPTGVRWSAVLVVGLVAGIGFTMALFIASLALPAGPLIDAAKLGILSASAVAALIGLAAGRLLLPPARHASGALTPEEAERSTDA